MPIENIPKMDEKKVWNFTNILAFSIFFLGFAYLFMVAFVLSKSDVKDNTTLSQITTGVLGLLTLTAAFYFGSSSGSVRQQATITEMQKTATTLAVKNASGTGTVDVDNKVDKAVAIEKLRAKLEGMQPDSEEALAILDEIKQLESQS